MEVKDGWMEDMKYKNCWSGCWCRNGGECERKW